MALKRRRKSNSAPVPKFKKLRSSVIVPAGTSVLVRKGEAGDFTNYTTKKQLHFTHFRAASKAALMFVHDEWSIWVSKKAIGYK